MIIHDFDISTEPIVSIESFYGKPNKIVEKCLVVFQRSFTITCSAVITVP